MILNKNHPPLVLVVLGTFPIFYKVNKKRFISPFFINALK